MIIELILNMVAEISCEFVLQKPFTHLTKPHNLATGFDECQGDRSLSGERTKWCIIPQFDIHHQPGTRCILCYLVNE